MDIDIHGLKKLFITRFVIPGSRERAMTKMNGHEKRNLFTKEVMDQKILDRKFIKRLDNAITIEEVIRKMKLNKTDLCYVISGNAAIDDKVMLVDYALKTFREKGMGGIIVNLSVQKIYLETNSQSSDIFFGEIDD